MAFTFDGVTPSEVIFNGVSVEKIIMDGVTVWESFNPATLLIDFVYTNNNDGTYTITDWKGTYNGVASTECIIPDSDKIIL